MSELCRLARPHTDMQNAITISDWSDLIYLNTAGNATAAVRTPDCVGQCRHKEISICLRSCMSTNWSAHYSRIGSIPLSISALIEDPGVAAASVACDSQVSGPGGSTPPARLRIAMVDAISISGRLPASFLSSIKDFDGAGANLVCAR